MPDEEKRDEDLLEEDEDDDVLDGGSDSEIAGTSSKDDAGPAAEDAVKEEDTFTGSDSSSDDTISQPSVETKTDEHQGGFGGDHTHDDHKDHDHSHEGDDHSTDRAHEHHAIVNQNKPWESRNVEIDGGSDGGVDIGEDEGMGTGAHTGGDEHISINKDDFWKYVKIIVVIAVLILGYNYFIADDEGDSGNVVVDEPAANQPAAVAKVEVSVDDDAVKGDNDAPVTIIEFSDYECPFCARFYSQTLSQIDEQYIKTGKVKLVYRDYPLSFHQQAQKAGEAAECAGEQGKYFDMHDKLFEDGVAGGVASFKQYAGEIGLNQAEFDTCLDSGAQAAEVQKDFADGSKYGVQGTPAFFINGKLISGAQPFNVFQQAIEAELA